MIPTRSGALDDIGRSLACGPSPVPRRRVGADR
jgi:hypothetical protein